MLCHNCGRENMQGQAFCAACGAPMIAPPVEGKPACKKKFSVLGFLCGLGVMGVLLLFLLLSPSQGLKDHYEKGFSSPEEAVTAYLEGLRDGDVEKMLSSFVVESYCENTNNLFINNGQKAWVSYLVEPCESLGALHRYSTASRYITLPCLILAQQPEGEFTYKPTQFPIKAAETVVVSPYFSFRKDEAQVKQFAELLRSAESKLSTLEIDGFLSFSEYSSMSRSEYEAFTEEIADSYGMDEIQTVVARVYLDGYELYCVMDVVCYDGEWYNYGSFISTSTADKIRDAGTDLFGTMD